MWSKTLVATVAMIGCEFGASETAPTTQTGELAAALLETHHRMHIRFDAAKQVEQAIAWDALDHAHSEANTIATLDEPDVLPTWRPYVDDIQATAREIQHAGDVISAAHLVGTLGHRCAACHVALGAHVSFPAEPPPRVDPKVGATMAGHQWAAVQMWEGLIGPSDDRWLAGATALTTVPLNLVAQASDDVDDVARVRLYARRALAMPSADDRAALFGTLLGTCAHCHSLLRDR
jgi:hypothetical protein